MSEKEGLYLIKDGNWSWPVTVISGPEVDLAKLNTGDVSLNVMYRQDHLALFLQSVADKIRSADYVAARSDLLVHIRELEQACIAQVCANRETVRMAEPLSTSLEKLMSEQLQSGTHCPSFEDLYEIYATESEGNGHSLFLNRLRQLAVPGEVIATLESFATSIGYLQYYVLLEYMVRKTYICVNQSQEDSDVKSVCHDEQISSDEAFSRLKSLIGPSIHPEVRAALTHVAKHCSSDRNVIGHMQGLILYIERLEKTVHDAKILCTGRKGLSLGLNEVSDFVRSVRSFSEFLDQCTVTCEDYDLYDKRHGELKNEVHALSRKLSVMEHLSNIDRDVLDESQLKHYRALVDSFNR